jgi:hypothetical protein
MKKILLTLTAVVAATSLWAQQYTGNAARDAKIEAERAKIAEGGIVVIDEQTAISLSDGDFCVDTKVYWPDNHFTKLIPKPIFSAAPETAIYESQFIVQLGKCEQEIAEKYIDELKSMGWDLNAESQCHETKLAFDAYNHSGMKIHFIYDKKSGTAHFDIDSED